MKWREEFLEQRPNKTIKDLQKECKMKKANKHISKYLKNQNEKEKHEKIKKEVLSMIND